MPDYPCAKYRIKELMRTRLLALTVFACAAGAAQNTDQTPSFISPVYSEINLGEIRPEGWLREQLQVMRDNSTGHLDEIYAKIREDNGWLGGKGENWEETPYWLDGAVPLAYQLGDTVLQKKVLQYINWNIENQRPSGYFGPITPWERETGRQVDVANCGEGQDWWPRMIMLKVMQQYYTATADERVIPFMQRYFTYQEKALSQCPIGNWTEWAVSRGSENIIILHWLYRETGDNSLLELAQKIESQSYPWSEWLGNRDWVINAAVNPDGRDWMQRHGVNVAMALKTPAGNFQRTGDSTYLKWLHTGFSDLMSLHGLPNGIFSADEDLHGNDPIQGTELCATVEAMFSLEEIIGITGDPRYMDALERAAFNAMPPQTTDDYNEKQYFQIANQIEIDRGVYAFTLPFNREMNNVLGARSGYTCCYANMHQGWTKFAQHLWYGTEGDGLAALHYSPNTIRTRVGASQQEVTIREVTDYPFGEEIRFEIRTEQPVQFPLELRIPGWCKEPMLRINGRDTDTEEGTQIIRIDREWKEGDVVTLTLPMEVRVSAWAENSRAVERGPLVYGLKMEESWDTGEDEKEGPYFTVHPTTPWNYGLLETFVQEPAAESRIRQRPLKSGFRWNQEHAPLEITLDAKQIPDWKAINGLAYLPVMGRDGVYKGEVSATQTTITLIPVGFTKLRIMAFPVVR